MTRPVLLIHLAGAATATALTVLLTALPFLPGEYDRLAIPLSAMAQMAGAAGLLVAPFGALWLISERFSRFSRWRFTAALLTVIASAPLWALLSLSAVIHSGFVLGLVILAAAGFAGRRAWIMLTKLRRGLTGGPLVIPLYLTIVPVASALLQFAMVERAVEFSRNRAIRNAAPLIAAIEQFHVTNGHYPVSLYSVWRDYAPGVIGIERYQYEPHFAAYNLVFEQFTYRFGTREFVVYNPRDQQSMTAHVFDLLELTPPQLLLEQQRGHYEDGLTPTAHWKYFRFD